MRQSLRDWQPIYGACGVCVCCSLRCVYHVQAARWPAGGVNFPALATPQHRLYLAPEPQGHGAQRAIGCEEGDPSVTLGLSVVGAGGGWGDECDERDASIASVMRIAS